MLKSPIVVTLTPLRSNIVLLLKISKENVHVC